jgi:hypothetical protein
MLILLSQKKNGRFFSQEVTGHFEYFLNTLGLDQKSKLVNPFDCPQYYPAFFYRIADDPKNLVIPESFDKEISSESSDDERIIDEKNPK